MAEIIGAVPQGTFSRGARRSRQVLDDEARALSADMQAVIRRTAELKRARRREQRPVGPSSGGAVERLFEQLSQYDRDGSRYLTPPTEEQMKECVRQYRAATSNEVLRQAACAVCARLTFATECTKMGLEELMEGGMLVPNTPHEAQRLTRGMLLYEEGLSDDSDRATAQVCADCAKALGNRRTPTYALANDMWIGEVPEELSGLTIPEQLLIALHYPRCFVFKLFPKAGGPRDPNFMQSGMAGNVTTYALNTPMVVDMLEGRLLPRRLSILASVLSVTFVGMGRLPKRWLKSTFRVRRVYVHAALQWLMAHNALYTEMTISDAILSTLPDDGVPAEILAMVRHVRSSTVVAAESAGYVPRDSDGEEGEEEAEEEEVEDETGLEAQWADGEDSDGEGGGGDGGGREGDVIPLQALGVTDTDLSTVSVKEMTQWALANLEGASAEGGYAVRHGTVPLSIFAESQDGDGRNPVAACFPTLFPYGVGGIDQRRPQRVPFMQHVRWCLTYADRRFRTHHSFPFVVFGIEQRRQVMSSARVQMKRRDFQRHARALQSLTIQDLKKAEGEEERGERISDPRVELLKRHMYSASSKVIGSDAKRGGYRTNMWGTTMEKGPQSAFATFNENDLDEPVVQVFAGETIDMDNFDRERGPDAESRALTVARDPFAAAQAFHYLTQVLLRTVFGVETTGFRVHSTGGVLGVVVAYLGVVEAQGRGTLHLHIIFWLVDTPTAAELEGHLTIESYRRRIEDFISVNIRGHLEGMDSKEAILAIPRERNVGYSRPPNPDSPSYVMECAEMERALVRAQQVHTCRRTTCLRFNKHGRLTCKRRAPFELAEENWVDEAGRWACKRTYGYLNNWCPTVTLTTRGNNDMKLTLSGREARAATWYTTKYTTKAQGKSFNRSAVMGRALAYHTEHSEYLTDLRDRQRLLLLRCLTSLNREQELSGPQVISYLMGWGDVYKSHNYVPIFWSSFTSVVIRAYPELRTEGVGDVGGREGREDEQDFVTVKLRDNGRMSFAAQVEEYLYRPVELENLNVHDYFVHTIEAPIPKVRTATTDDGRRGRGRPRNEAFSYLREYEGWEEKCRRMRTVGHNTLASVQGKYFERRDVENSLYCANILAFLLPWREPSSLKVEGQSWTAALESFERNTDKRTLDIIANIEYYYETSDAAARDRESEEPGAATGRGQMSASRVGEEALANMDDDEEQDVGQSSEDGVAMDVDDIEVQDGNVSEGYSSEEDMLQGLTARANAEARHGRDAIEAGERAGLFTRYTDYITQRREARVAMGDDIRVLAEWHARSVAQRIEVGDAERRAVDGGDVQVGRSGLVDAAGNVQHLGGQDVADIEEALNAVDPSELLEEQRRAFDIVESHVRRNVRGEDPEPLLMVITGEGGVGKSKVIQTITAMFDSLSVRHWLRKGAYTGVAASLVEGQTLHTLCAIPRSGDQMSAQARQRLASSWYAARYFIIDEMSMVSAAMLSKIEKIITTARAGVAENRDGRVFGGLSVVLLGDFHQFPPVGGGATTSLFAEWGEDAFTSATAVGRAIFEQFTTVVRLRTQVRVQDEEWLDALRRSRHGNCTRADIRMFRSLILGSRDCPPTDFSTEPWKSAVLITPRHAVRVPWNAAALRAHCKETGAALYRCHARDRIANRRLRKEERRAVRAKQRGKMLPDVLEIAIGMKVMVTFNIDTNSDITNGARGIIHDIILSSGDDENVREDGSIRLGHLPVCVLVKLDRTRAAGMEGMPEGVIPVVPLEKEFTIATTGDGRVLTVKRFQLPLTAAYAFTDYRAQGQTIPYVLIDIRSPPSFKLTAFNAYVALSRSRGRDSIRLIGDFDERLFTQHPSEMLRKEDVRLEELDRDTKRSWEADESRGQRLLDALR